MEYIQRKLEIDFPPRQSAFLWGARKTGKSTYLRNRFPGSIYYDFLQSDTFFDFTKNPSLLGERRLPERRIAVSRLLNLTEDQP